MIKKSPPKENIVHPQTQKEKAVPKYTQYVSKNQQKVPLEKGESSKQHSADHEGLKANPTTVPPPPPPTVPPQMQKYSESPLRSEQVVPLLKGNTSVPPSPPPQSQQDVPSPHSQQAVPPPTSMQVNGEATMDAGINCPTESASTAEKKPLLIKPPLRQMPMMEKGTLMQTLPL